MNEKEISAARLHAEVRRRYGNPTEFVAAVSEQLEQYGITQADLALVAGYDRWILNRWLRGRVTIPLHAMLIVDEALERLVDAEMV